MTKQKQQEGERANGVHFTRTLIRQDSSKHLRECTVSVPDGNGL